MTGWFKFGGDPVVGLLKLGFEEADVIEGEAQDALDRQHEGLVEVETLLGYPLKLVRVVERVWEVISTELAQVGGQVLDRQIGQLV